MKEVFRIQTKLDYVFLIKTLWIIAAVGTIIYIFGTTNLYWNSDTAAYNLMVREQISEHSLIPSTYYNSTDTLLWHINIPMILLSPFIHDQLLLRSLGCFVIAIVAMVSLWLADKYIFENRSFWIVGFLFLLGPFSDHYDLLYGQSSYMPQIYQMLIVVSLFCMAAKDSLSLGKSYKTLIFSFIFIFFSIQTLTVVQNYIFPLAAAIAIMFIYNNNSDHTYFKGAKFSRFFTTELIIVSLMIVSVLLNYIIFKNAHFGRQGYPLIDAAGIGKNIIYFISWLPDWLFGMESGALLYSAAGISNLIKFVFGTFIYFIFPIMLYKKFNEQSEKVKMFLMFCLVYIISNLIIVIGHFDLTIDDWGATMRYFSTIRLLLIILCGYFLNKYVLTKNIMGRHLVIIALSLCVLLFAIPRNAPITHYADIMNEKREITNFLKAENLDYGYATFWNANKNMVLSNFDVKIGGVFLDKLINPFLWLSSEKFYNPDSHEGDTFLMLTAAEAEQFSENTAYLGTPERTIEHAGYVIYVYDYNIAENGFAGRIKDINLIKSVLLDGNLTSEEAIRIKPASIMFGPYMNALAGKYSLDIDIQCQEIAILSIYYNKGADIIGGFSLNPGKNNITFELPVEVNDLETVIRNDHATDITITELLLNKVD